MKKFAHLVMLLCFVGCAWLLTGCTEEGVAARSPDAPRIEEVHLEADVLTVSEIRVLNDKDQVVVIIGVNEDGSGYISVIDANGEVRGGFDATPGSGGMWWHSPGSSAVPVEEEAEEADEEFVD